jgi:hypothetical protein
MAVCVCGLQVDADLTFQQKHALVQMGAELTPAQLTRYRAELQRRKEKGTKKQEKGTKKQPVCPLVFFAFPPSLLAALALVSCVRVRASLSLTQCGVLCVSV